MNLQLRQAQALDCAFCEHLSRCNMQPYHMARAISWDPQRFAQTWQQFENYLICRARQDLGLLRLLVVDGYLEIRDLQLLPEFTGQGIGQWAIAQAVQLAKERKINALRLRVYEENPARRLYERHGFVVVSEIDRTLHMVKNLDTEA